MGALAEGSRALLRRGWHVPAIRPPTVPRGTARLRVALSAAHTEPDVRALAADLRLLVRRPPPAAAAAAAAVA